MFVYALVYKPDGPSWSKVFENIKNSHETTEVDAALLLGVLRIESVYGTNIGQPAEYQKQQCPIEKESEFNGYKEEGVPDWKDKTSREIEQIAQTKCDRYFKELNDLFCNPNDSKCNCIANKTCAVIPTSFTFAIGFTQFMPSQWSYYATQHTDLQNPWSYKESLLATGYKLREGGALSNEGVALKSYNNSDQYVRDVQLKKSEWQELFDKANKAYCNNNGDVGCTLEKLQSVFSEAGGLCTVLKPGGNPNFECLEKKVNVDNTKVQQVTKEDAQKQLDALKKQLEDLQKQLEQKKLEDQRRIDEQSRAQATAEQARITAEKEVLRRDQPVPPIPMPAPPPTPSPQQTLVVSILVNPLNGTAPLNNVSIKASVFGTAQGTVNYTFYCNRSDSGTNITTDWNAKFDGIPDETKTAICNYSNSGTYTVKVIAERGNATPAEVRMPINVASPRASTPNPKATRLTIQLVGPYGAPMSGLNGSLMWATQVKEYLYLIDAVGDRVPGGFVGENDQDYSFTFRTKNGVWTFGRDIPAGQYTVIFKGGYSNVQGFSYSNRGISWGAFDKTITVPDSNGSWFVKINIPEQKSWIKVNLYADVVNQVGTAVNLEGSKLTLIDTNGKLYECESWSCGTKDGKIKGDFGYLEGGNYTFRVENSGYATFEKVIQVPDVSKIPAYDDEAYKGYGDIKLGTIVLTKI